MSHADVIYGALTEIYTPPCLLGLNRQFLLTPKSQFFISPLIPQFDRQLPFAPQLSITLSLAEPQ
jgi:hypothetical protein